MLEFKHFSFTAQGFEPCTVDVVAFDGEAQYTVISCCTFRETWRVFFSFNQPETVARAKYFSLWAIYLGYDPETLPAFMDAGATATLY